MAGKTRKRSKRTGRFVVVTGKRGRGFFSKLFNVAKKVGKFVKKNRIISQAANLLPGATGQKVAGVAGALGLGRSHKLQIIRPSSLGLGKKKRSRGHPVSCTPRNNFKLGSGHRRIGARRRAARNSLLDPLSGGRYLY